MKITKFIPNAITRKVAKEVLVLKRNSPHIFFAVGIVGVVGGTVLACKATMKVGDVLDEMKEDVEAVKNDLNGTTDYQRDLAYAYVQGTARIVKLYAPAVLVTGVSIAALTGSHVQLTKRNTTLTIAYAGLQKAYEEYRERVRQELGEEKERDIYHGVTTEKVKIDGKTVDQKTVDPNKLSPYARVFDKMSSNWQPEPEYNMLFLKAQQNYFNHLLQSRRHVFLNEVYDALDIPRTRVGQVVGWYLDGEGDDYIDFGLYRMDNARFVNGIENAILLDFNVDGLIQDKL